MRNYDLEIGVLDRVAAIDGFAARVSGATGATVSEPGGDDHHV